jgi:hypothetical protein
MTNRIHGILSPVLAPFNARLEPDVKRYIAHCQWLVGNNVGLAIFGTNSEAAPLSVSERLNLTDALLAAGIPAQRMNETCACRIFRAGGLENGAAATHAIERRACAKTVAAVEGIGFQHAGFSNGLAADNRVWAVRRSAQPFLPLFSND